MKDLIRKIALKLLPDYKYRKLSFSQYGEDLIIRSLFLEHVRLEKPTYLDIGAHHPFHLNNTALFHIMGSTGTNIEANPDLIGEFYKHRKNDRNLNIGVTGDSNCVLPFYVMEQPELNTFLKETAKALEERGYPINREIHVQCYDLNFIIKEYCSDRFPDFLSIDAEGLDEVILENYDFSRTKPKIICIENFQTDSNGKYYKRRGIRNILTSNGYVLVADTFVNDIFIDKVYVKY